VDAYGISQVTPGGTGIHLSWSGPRSWVYAPGGWTVRRRLADRVVARDCERLDAVAIAELRTVRERQLGFGALTLRPGGWLSALDGSGPPAEATPTEVFRLDLDAEHRLVRIVVTAKLSLAAAFCEGRVVGVSGPADGTATHVLHATRIDAAVAFTLDPTALLLCVDVRAADEVEQWQDVPAIAERLTLPFRELMPELIDEADELAEARRRLLPGEDIGQEEFARLAAVIRPGLRAAGPPRPSELVLLLREPPDGDPDEARALDPIRVLLAHPTWRRALGFALFDDDPALVVGERYEYRISATFPAPDVWDANHGFATVPSGRLVPADFALGGLRLRTQQPVPVGLTPGTPMAGSVRITRRGIALDPRREWFWLHPTLDDWSLVIDFPEPVRSVILELAPDHRLDFAGGAATDPFAGTAPVPPGPRPRLDFGSPVEQLRLRGTGFLHAVRIPSVADGPLEIAMVLPSIVLVDTPLPAAPLSASATGLQLPTAAPTELVPAAEPAARHGLGFRVRWRPAPAFGLTDWAPDLEAPPPLDATIFQVERRVEPDGPWAPVLDEANWTLGDRGDPQRDLTLTPGTDLMQVFSESGPLADGAALDLTLMT
jgi:hypothetical protein